MHIVFLLLLSLFVARGDDGVGIDPFGRRTVRGSSGCSIDPSGACRVGGLSDEGNGFDPHG
jgi:hypothetical protein